MNPNESPVNGNGPIFYNREQAEQPGTSSFNSMESSNHSFYSVQDYQELNNIFFKTNDELEGAMCNGSCLCGKCLTFPDDWTMGTEHDHGSSPLMVSPVSTYSSPIMPFTPEDAETLSAMEVAKSVIDNNSGNCINVRNSENYVLPAELSRPGCSRTCTGCLSACHDAHRLTASEVAIGRQFFKGVKKKNSDKWTCEIRISKKLQKDREVGAKAKLWLGTFHTRCQAARALHVGRFLLSEKKKSTTDATNFDQSSKNILSKFKSRMRGKALDAALLDEVKKLAIEYGKNGSL